VPASRRQPPGAASERDASHLEGSIRRTDNLSRPCAPPWRDIRHAQRAGGDRSERVRTYNFPQNRVTDHRIGLTLYRLDNFMEGNIGEIIDALNTHYQAEALRAGSLGG